jgi:hypothetical protein
VNEISTNSLKYRPIPREPARGSQSIPAVAVEVQLASAMSLQEPATPRFTLDGSHALEAHLASVCDRVAREVMRIIPPAQLEGLLLAGGYGRGEGGVLREASGDRPYNDLEFYVFVRGNAVLAERRYRAALCKLGQRLQPGAGLEVEFKVFTLKKLRRSGPSMFFYDLVSGHRWLIGNDSLLAGCEHHRDPGSLPLHEATRLLFNRCSGLLFSADRLRRAQFGPEEADFVGRNLAKAQLGIGDALLAAQGKYHWSCLERAQCLAKPSTCGNLPRGQIIRHHAAGVLFKLHPVRSNAPSEDLARQHAELTELAGLVWLQLERRRLGFSFESHLDYAVCRRDKCPESPPLLNRLVNARTFGPLVSLRSRGSRYPRERLFNALALLLWEKDAVNNASLLRVLQRELNTRATGFAELVAAYEQLWHRFN